MTAPQIASLVTAVVNLGRAQAALLSMENAREIHALNLEQVRAGLAAQGVRATVTGRVTDEHMESIRPHVSEGIAESLKGFIAAGLPPELLAELEYIQRTVIEEPFDVPATRVRLGDFEHRLLAHFGAL
jgi:hypothetical protein